jgi:hypothetical protein
VEALTSLSIPAVIGPPVGQGTRLWHVRLGKDALDLIKSVRPYLPQGKREVAEVKPKAAKMSLEESQATLDQLLGPLDLLAQTIEQLIMSLSS